MKIILKGSSSSTHIEIGTWLISLLTFRWKNKGWKWMFLSKSKVGICNRFRFLLLPFVTLASQEAVNIEKLCWKKQYKMCVHLVYSSFLFPLRVLLRPLKAVAEANLTFLRSLHFLMYLRPLFNPFTPMSDQHRISHYNINTISTR